MDEDEDECDYRRIQKRKIHFRKFGYMKKSKYGSDNDY